MLKGVCTVSIDGFIWQLNISIFHILISHVISDCCRCRFGPSYLPQVCISPVYDAQLLSQLNIIFNLLIMTTSMKGRYSICKVVCNSMTCRTWQYMFLRDSGLVIPLGNSMHFSTVCATWHGKLRLKQWLYCPVKQTVSVKLFNTQHLSILFQIQQRSLGLHCQAGFLEAYSTAGHRVTQTFLKQM